MTTPKPIELPGLHVSIDDVRYAPHVHSSPERPHPFIYYITIRNDSPLTVTIKGRKWVVRESNGQTIVVEGDGVIGKFPLLAPGEEFSYNSCHTVATDGTAEGAYFAAGPDGSLYYTRIPTFDLSLPNWI